MFRFLKTGFQKIKNALKKTGSFFGKKLRSFFASPLDESRMEELEQILFEADLGSKIVTEWKSRIAEFHRKKPETTGDEYLAELQKLGLEILDIPSKIAGNEPLIGAPRVILIVGTNGSGKTTTIAKLAHMFQEDGQKVLLAAADTFRAAAVDQLEIWAKRLNTEIVLGASGGDPSAVLFDAMAKAKAKAYDVVICDTAGRLESKSDLMRELEKMVRIAKKQDALAPHEIFLVVDGNLGQTAIEQARIFNKFAPLTGIIITKLDGSAKGGVALAIYQELGIPIKYLGSGEKIDDLSPFDPKTYMEALFST